MIVVDFLYSVIEGERTLSSLGLQFDKESARSCGFDLGILACAKRNLRVCQEVSDIELSLLALFRMKPEA